MDCRECEEVRKCCKLLITFEILIFIFKFEISSSIWHHEESKVLLSKRNGDLEWKLFCRNPSNESGRITAEQLLKHLILKRLEFGSLKQIFCLSFQRDFCILQTSSKQIVGLRLRTNLDSEVVWAIEVGEFAVWTFCDKNFINYEPHSKDLRTLCDFKLFKNIYSHFLKQYSLYYYRCLFSVRG